MAEARVVTGAVAAAGMAAAVLWLPTPAVAAVLAAFAAAGAWEWGGLVGLQGAARSLYVGAVLAMLVALWPAARGAGLEPVLAAALLWWAGALAWETRPQVARGAGAAARLLKLLAGVLVLAPAWTALVWLHGAGQRGPALLLYVLALVWVADSAAYYAGRRWGRHRLAPRLSPGKTWEGLGGGLAGAGLFALAAGLAAGQGGADLARWTALGLLAALASVAGDLFESLIKRHAGVKDSGSLFPGHGGVLDRIDSLTAAAPVFVAGLRWL